MMAILNRRQELPRDSRRDRFTNRAELYDQASRVLLHNWDVDYKRLKLPLDTIRRREKQEMLRLVAYEMQAGDTGLKGNAIDAGRLTQVLTNYLKDQGFSEPREKANPLIDQLRHRNFILCDRGGDIYGFVHRTFLEYFCAVEIVHRFEKQRTLTFEQLRDEVFGQHWQDETWHEVLRLICGAIDAKFAGQLIEFLMTREWNQQKHPEYFEIDMFDEVAKPKEKERNLRIAVQCLTEVREQSQINEIVSAVLRTLHRAIRSGYRREQALLLRVLVDGWKDDPETLVILKQLAQQGENFYTSSPEALRMLVDGWKDDPETLVILKQLAQRGENNFSDSPPEALRTLVDGWKDDPETLVILKQLAQDEDKATTARLAAIDALVHGWKGLPELYEVFHQVAKGYSARHECCSGESPRVEALRAIFTSYPHHPKTLPLFHDRVANDLNPYVRAPAINMLVGLFKDAKGTLPFLKDRAKLDEDHRVRLAAINALVDGWKGLPEICELLYQVATGDIFERKLYFFAEDNPRHTALQALLTHYSTHPKTLELLRDRAENDPDEQLREWAQEQLEMQNVKLKMEESSDG